MMNLTTHDLLTLHPIAHIETDFPTKFGLPRQSGLAQLRGKIVFEPEFRVPAALKGIDAYSHLWLIWEFSEAIAGHWSPTVRPPRLGGNTRMGVFATRSPFRPNHLGLSVVKLIAVEKTEQGDVLVVSGADLMDGTPIFDIKPYLPYVDAIPDARGSFSDEHKGDKLDVIFPEPLLSRIPEIKRDALIETLSLDPRPAYQTDETRVYGFYFASFNIRFTVKGQTLTVCAVETL